MNWRAGKLFVSLLVVAASAMACSDSPSGPTTGDLTIQVSGLPNGALAAITVTGPSGFSRAVSATSTLTDLTTGEYVVSAAVVAEGGESFGATSPSQAVTLGGGGATATVQYVSLRSAVSVTASGLPTGASPLLRIEGEGLDQTLTAAGVVAGLAPGTYTISAQGVVAGDSTYQAQPLTRSVVVSADGAVSADFAYAAVGHRTLNLVVDAMYVVQAVQTLDRAVPLVANRDAYLRVFARADQQNKAKPALRVRLYNGATLLSTSDIPLEAGTVPTSISQGTTTGNWTVRLPAATLQPGLRVEVELDALNSVREANEGDNRLPAAGGPLQLAVHSTPPLRILMVPIHQAANNLTGNLTETNRNAYLTMTRKIMPVSSIDADLRASYTVNGPAFDPAGSVWSVIVSELDAVRVAEGSGRYYYGVVKTEYNGGGVVGIAAGIPSRTSLGWDRFPDAPNTMAHELGHNFGRRHVPCGATAGNDPAYPYATGIIGSFGLDPETRELKTPADFTDIMGYCDAAWWISDYTFTNILNYRAQADAAMQVATSQLSLLVWGRIVDGKPVLEPAFQVITTPRLPTAPGAYRLEGVSAAGERLFQLSFDGERLHDVEGDQRIFSFAIPLSGADFARLTTLSVTGGGETSTVEANRPADGVGRILPFERYTLTESSPGHVRVNWDTAEHDAVMVRDPRTREILTIARGGSAEVMTDAGELELVGSNGVSSTMTRARVLPR